MIVIDIPARAVSETLKADKSVQDNGRAGVVIGLDAKQIQDLLYFIGLHPEAENHPVVVGLVQGLRRLGHVGQSQESL